VWKLTAEDVEPLALGAALLGSGGGGSTTVAERTAYRMLRSAPITMVAPRELDPDSWIVPIGLVGSVTLFEEKLLSGQEWQQVLATLSRYSGISADALMPFEAAGVNALLPVAAAASLALPLVDADVMGRAFPGLDQTTLTLNNLPVAPMALCNEQGMTAVFDRVNPYQAERLARSAVVTMGGWAIVAFAPQRASDMARCAIHRSMARALRFGRRLRQHDLDGLLHVGAGRSLFRGKVIQVEREVGDRYGRGCVVLEHLSQPERLLALEFQNENLIAIEDGIVRASVPDLICTLETENLTSVNTEQLRYGLELDVIRLPCPPNWRTQSGLGLVGPRAFGYRSPYVLPGVVGAEN
jgi:DUF917 family protein